MRLVKPSTLEEKRTRSTVDTLELSQKLVASWKIPPFQRELKVNAKVEAVAKAIGENGGVLPGILTIGVLDGDIYIVDGQHRVQAFAMSGEEVGYADVRTVFFQNMAEMAEEFEQLNSQLVTLRPDDKLRALEHSVEALQMIRKKCPFIGYSMVRRGKTAAILSMSTFIRVWCGSRGDAPSTTVPASTAVKNMDRQDTERAIEFVELCFTAWQRDPEFFRLWGGLNLVILAWLYRRLVLGEGSVSSSRWSKLSRDQFRRGLQALSADAAYLEFLVGRNVSDRDRAPAYNRIRTAFMRRLKDEVGKLQFPSPPWARQ